MTPSIRTARDLRQKATQAEQVAWELLRNRRLLGAKFRRQQLIGDRTVDFYCFELRLAVELDGSVHAQPSQIRKDRAKDAYLKRLGIQVLRVPNGLVLQDPQGFLERIRQRVPSPGALRHPRSEGESLKQYGAL